MGFYGLGDKIGQAPGRALCKIRVARPFEAQQGTTKQQASLKPPKCSIGLRWIPAAFGRT